MPPREVLFANHNRANIVRIPAGLPGGRIVELLAVPTPRAVMVVNGGTIELGADLTARLRPLLWDGLARVASEERLTVVTGGTDAGIFSLFGPGRARWHHREPCIGVAVAQLVIVPDEAQEGIQLEPHHSHFVLVEGEQWGDETGTMYALVDALASACPSVAVFANGGEIVIREMQANVRQGRTMVVIGGSGRSSDALIAARMGTPVDDTRFVEIAATGVVLAFPIEQQPSALSNLIRCTLFPA